MFQVQGYVVYTLPCRACAPDEDCKPCVSNIYLSTEKRPKDDRIGGAGQIAVRVSIGSKYKVGDKVTLRLWREGSLYTAVE